MNGVQESWRLQVARSAAGVYARNPKVAAVVAAGSVGAGIDDEWSDLELDVYWLAAPTDADRRDPIALLDGAIEQFWAYSPDEEEWGEEYRVGGLGVGISSFLVESAERLLERVGVEGDASTNAQVRVAAIASCVALHGDAIVEAWRPRAERYPDSLRERMVQRYLTPDRIDGWHLRDALVYRRDLLALHDVLGRGGRSVLGALHGLNRVLLSNPRMKWERHLLGRFAIAPPRLATRFEKVWTGDLRGRVLALHSLLTDTVDLAEAQLALDLSDMRRAIEHTRPRLERH